MMRLADFAIFYATAGVLIGGVMAAGPKITVPDRNGKPMRHPRLIAFFVLGLFWPLVIYRLLFGMGKR